MRIGLLAEPPRIIAWRQNERHAVVNVRYKFVGIGGDDGKGPQPLT
jgi:hypothetical protein